jgi:P27 family predicted phage terminase small subunit
MGTRGPKPLPANVHLLRGNPSKKPSVDLFDEFRPEVEVPDSPSWLWPEAKKEWKRVSVELEKYGLISRLDRAALVLYVQAWAKMVWAEKQMSRAMKLAEQKRAEAEANGEEYKGGDGIMVATANGNQTYSHYWVVGRRAAEDVNRYLALFGLSPSSRSRVSTSDNRQSSLPLDGAGNNAWDGV